MRTQQKRISHHINRRPAANIHHATRCAAGLGYPLNLFVTINFTELGVAPDKVSQIMQKVVGERFAPWLRRTASNDNGLAPTYVWTVEAANGVTAVHWLLHAPSQLKRRVGVKIGAWLQQFCAFESLPNQALLVRDIINIVGLKRYILKGTEANYARAIGIQPSDQGIVFGKRSGFSKNLGPTARQRYGYRSRSFRGYSAR